MTNHNIDLEPGAVLITGAGGFVGQHLMQELNLGAGDYAADSSSDFSVPAGVNGIEWELPFHAPAELGSVKYIIHLASISSVARSFREENMVMNVNLGGTISILNYMKERSPDARLLYISSADVYGSKDGIITEEDIPNPINPYAKSKVAAEKAVLREFSESGLDIVIARPFAHFGPGQSPGFALPSFCRRIVKAIATGERSIRVGNVESVRDYLYVTDVTQAYKHILKSGVAGEIYNICTGNGITVENMVKMLIEISGADLTLNIDKELFRPADIDFQVGNPVKLESLHGWTPEISRQEGLEMLYNFWKDRK